MQVIYPQKLKQGDEVRVVSPSDSLAKFSHSVISLAKERFEDILGLRVTFGEHARDYDNFGSSPIESRVADLHVAFKDKGVKMVISAYGGFNSNQLLNHLDYDLIENNPKIFAGYSDITALHNAIHSQTGLVTYSSPTFVEFGVDVNVDYTLSHFKRAFFGENHYNIMPSKEFANNLFDLQATNTGLALTKNPGPYIINSGYADGRLIGGNLSTLSLLQGTRFMPDLEHSVLFIEEAGDASVAMFDRYLQGLLHQPGADRIKGLVIGRFQKNSGMDRELLEKVISSKKELTNIPIIADADFGHTYPQTTFPIGGRVRLDALSYTPCIMIAAGR